MLIKVIRAKYIKDHVIEFIFNDGLKSEVDLKNEIEGEIFMPLKDLQYFKTFSLNRWTIEWENGADFAPEFLYQLAIEKEKRAHKSI